MKLALTIVTLIALGGTAHAQQGVIPLSQDPPGSGTSYGSSPTYGGGESYDKTTQLPQKSGDADSSGDVPAPKPLPSPPPAHRKMQIVVPRPDIEQVVRAMRTKNCAGIITDREKQAAAETNIKLLYKKDKAIPHPLSADDLALVLIMMQCT